MLVIGYVVHCVPTVLYRWLPYIIHVRVHLLHPLGGSGMSSSLTSSRKSIWACSFVQLLSTLLELLLARGLANVHGVNRSLRDFSMMSLLINDAMLKPTGADLCAMADAVAPPDEAPVSTSWFSCVDAVESEDSLATLSVMPGGCVSMAQHHKSVLHSSGMSLRTRS